MVVVLLMVLFLALVSVGVWAYSRSLLTSAAAQAARYAANADVPDSAASRRAADLMTHTIAGSTADTVACTSAATDQRLIEVHCTMDSPGLVALLDGVLPPISVTAHALREIP